MKLLFEEYCDKRSSYNCFAVVLRQARFFKHLFKHKYGKTVRYLIGKGLRAVVNDDCM